MRERWHSILFSWYSNKKVAISEKNMTNNENWLSPSPFIYQLKVENRNEQNQLKTSHSQLCRSVHRLTANLFNLIYERSNDRLLV